MDRRRRPRSTTLKLYIFFCHPQAFCSALAATGHPISLLNDIHLALMKFLLLTDKAGGSVGAGVAIAPANPRAEMKLFHGRPHLPGHLLHTMTWPMFAAERIQRA